MGDCSEGSFVSGAATLGGLINRISKQSRKLCELHVFERFKMALLLNNSTNNSRYIMTQDMRSRIVMFSLGCIRLCKITRCTRLF